MVLELDSIRRHCARCRCVTWHWYDGEQWNSYVCACCCQPTHRDREGLRRVTICVDGRMVDRWV